jgi:hypothetical protein
LRNYVRAIKSEIGFQSHELFCNNLKQKFLAFKVNSFDMLYLSGKIKKFEVISAVLVASSLFLCVLFIRSFYEDQLRQYKLEAAILKETLDRLKVKISTPRYPFATSYERKDYQNHELIQMELKREGPGEQGKEYVLTDYQDIERNKKIVEKFGFYGVASDHISVNRSLPDFRLPK